MRILQVLPELNVGGVETGTIDFAKYLKDNGHYPVVVSNGGTLVAELEKYGITHYRLPVHRKFLFAVASNIGRLRAIIDEENIDIVHARSRVPAWIAFFACRKTNARFITTCHGYYSKHFFSSVMGWGKLVICLSHVIGRHMIDDFHVPAENIRYIHRSVDLERFPFIKRQKQKKREFVVTIIGRITQLKGHAYFLKAIARVVRTLPNIRVWIVGDSPKNKTAYKQELELLIKRLGISNYVEFLGNRSDVPKILAQSDVLVLSTITQEAFGRVIIEAQAVGVPVVATQVGGVVEIIDHEKTGLMVMPKDVEGMAAAIVRVLKDTAFADTLVSNAREKLESHYTLERMAEKTLAVYREVLGSLNILAIKISSVGDVILVTQALKSLRKKYPKANIYCLVGRASTLILQRCAHIDGLIVCDSKTKGLGVFSLVWLVQKLRNYRFDVVVDFQNNRLSHLLSFLTGANHRYGYHRKWGFFLTNAVRQKYEKLPPVQHQFKVLELLGIKCPQDPALELAPSGEAVDEMHRMLETEWLSDTSHIVGINIAASERWETKNWPVEHIAKLCDILAKKNIRVVLTGMDKDKDRAQYLLSLAKTKPASFVGRTDIMQLAALIKRSSVFITPDSAPMHIAAAVQTPFIVFFGPTSSVRHLPPAKNFVVLERQPACAPCYSSRCRILTHVCLTEISPDEVARHVEQLLEVKKTNG